MKKTFEQKANIAYNIALALYFIQIALIFFTTMWWVPTHKSPNYVIGFFVATPLIILLPWMLKRNIRAFIWLCFVQLGYFMPAVQHMFMYEQYGFMPFVETALVFVLFCVAMMFARWEQKRYGISVTR